MIMFCLESWNKIYELGKLKGGILGAYPAKYIYKNLLQILCNSVSPSFICNMETYSQTMFAVNDHLF